MRAAKLSFPSSVATTSYPATLGDTHCRGGDAMDQQRAPPPPPEQQQQQQQPDEEPLLPQLGPEELGGKCISDEVGALNCLAVALGHRTGLYAVLRRAGRATSSQLAAAAGLSERWVREWLYAQAAARYVACDKEAATFWLTEAQAAVLVEPEELADAHEAPLEYLLMVPPLLGRFEALAECFRTGKGLGFDGLGAGYFCQGHRHARGVQLGRNLASLPGLHERLLRGASVADVGCGSGDTLLHLAATYPSSRFSGYEVSRGALEAARRRREARGLANVEFFDASRPEGRLPAEPRFDLVIAQEAMHDMPDPQAMLLAIRQSLLPDDSSGGTGEQQGQQQADALAGYAGGPALIIVDIRSGGSAAANVASPGGPLVYGLSLSVCLCSGLSEEGGGAGLGTAGFHEGVAREMSAAAGFGRFSKLDWEPSVFNSSYLLRA